MNANVPYPFPGTTDVAIQRGLLEFPEHFFTLRNVTACPTVKDSKIKNKPQKIHVPVLLNGNKATVKFIFKYVFYTSKYNTAKTKLEVPPTIALFSSVELFLIYTVPCGQYQNLPQQALSSFKSSVFKISYKKILP